MCWCHLTITTPSLCDLPNDVHSPRYVIALDKRKKYCYLRLWHVMKRACLQFVEFNAYLATNGFSLLRKRQTIYTNTLFNGALKLVCDVD